MRGKIVNYILWGIVALLTVAFIIFATYTTVSRQHRAQRNHEAICSLALGAKNPVVIHLYHCK